MEKFALPELQQEQIPRVLFPPQQAKIGLAGDPGIRELKKALAHDGPLGMTVLIKRKASRKL